MQKLKALEKLFSSSEGMVLLVEGKHDIAALRAVGVDSRFVTTNGTSGRIAEKLGEACGRMRPSRVFLMLDFDREGLRKQTFFKAFLEEQGFSVDALFARKLRSLLGFTHVEEIERKYADLKKKGELHGKNVR
ncbi:MAG TPA: toprim domain-containing protein [Candidatus Norongarragalinales archaeon]|nr:toprim domain-containing protein [Candidatus Norongarragalinales archaeon]